MPSPVPRHLRTQDEVDRIPRALRAHIVDIHPDPANGVRIPNSRRHRAKFAPGLPTELVSLAGTENIGDPMAGTGMLAWETGLPVAVNDINEGLTDFLEPLREKGSDVSYLPASEVAWQVQACVFSPPYYPRTDRRRPNAHDDDKRGPVVGFRDSYECDHPKFIGNPGGVGAILAYREAMTSVYAHLATVCRRMVVVTKNWTRLGVELRLDLDTILMCEDAGWTCVRRHGWAPPPSLWAIYNARRGGGVLIEDILVFEREGQQQELAA